MSGRFSSLPACLSALSLVLPGLLLAACSGRGTTSNVVTDQSGRQVHLPDTVRRVVSLAPNVTELIFAAGSGDKLVAVTTADDYPPEIAELDKLDAVPVNFESVLALAPDVVVMNTEVNKVDDADRLVELGVPAVMVATESIYEVAEDVRWLGMLLHSEDSASQQAGMLQHAVDSLRARTSSIPDVPRVLFLIGYNTLYAMGAGSHIHDVIAVAGGASITTDLRENPVLNEEYVLTQDPDFILVAGDGSFRARDLTDAHPAFAQLAAVKNNRVYGVNADHVLRPGPRLISGAYSIAAILHPTLYGNR